MPLAIRLNNNNTDDSDTSNSPGTTDATAKVSTTPDDASPSADHVAIDIHEEKEEDARHKHMVVVDDDNSEDDSHDVEYGDHTRQLGSRTTGHSQSSDDIVRALNTSIETDRDLDPQLVAGTDAVYDETEMLYQNGLLEHIDVSPPVIS